MDQLFLVWDGMGWGEHDGFMCASVLLWFKVTPGPELAKPFEVRPAHSESLWHLRSSSKLINKQRTNKQKSVLFAHLSAESRLTMWMKSTGVAVYKSQCSLSRMILSMRRISAVEKLHPLRITRSFTEPITCVNKREANKHPVLNQLRCGHRFFYF